MSKKLVMLNWRDPWNPRAGGAELVTLRVLERLARDHGWDVEWFSSQYSGARDSERVDNIRYVRAGSELTVRFHAAARYRSAKDVVLVDQINTLPFFTPLYHRGATLLFMHQLAREVWWYEAAPPLAFVGYASEGLMLRPYRKTPFVTVSESSKDSMRGIGLRGRAFIIPEAIDEAPDDGIPTEKTPYDIVVVGRVAPSKRIEASIKAASLLQARGWSGRLHIVGAGNPRYVDQLVRLSSREKLRNITFHGRVSNSERQTLMRSASLLWMTSVREGWGLVVSEAAQHFTPAIAYNSPGLRDSIQDGKTGLLVQASPAQLAEASYEVFQDRDRWTKMAVAAHSFSSKLSWDATAAAFNGALEYVRSSWHA